jgi:hypothetical protein
VSFSDHYTGRSIADIVTLTPMARELITLRGLLARSTTT